MRIINTNVKIEFKQTLEKDHLGLSTYTQDLIEIATIDIGGKFISSRCLRETLLHEIAHFYLYKTGNDDINNERTAEVLAMFSDFILTNQQEILDLLKDH